MWTEWCQEMRAFYSAPSWQYGWQKGKIGGHAGHPFALPDPTFLAFLSCSERLTQIGNISKFLWEGYVLHQRPFIPPVKRPFPCLGSMFFPWPFGSCGGHSSQLVMTCSMLHPFLISKNSEHIINNSFIQLSSVAQFGYVPSASCWDSNWWRSVHWAPRIIWWLFPLVNPFSI